MRVYWYWPYLRSEQLPLVDSLCALDCDVVAHTVASRITAADAQRGRGAIDRSLSDVGDERERSMRWLWSRATIYPLRSKARRHKASKGFDVAHVVFLNPFTDWFALRRLSRRVALVASVHDAVPHQSRLPRWIEHLILRRLYAVCGEIVVHHATVSRQLQEQFSVDASRIHEVPLWVLPAPFELRERPNDVPTVLCFGAMRRNKGIEVLLAAIANLADLNATFVFAGRGAPEIEHALTQAATNDPRIKVEIGYVDEERKHALHRDADLIVLPYTSFASQSAVLHDAYGHGRPVVATDVGALGETVRDDDTGVVVPASDPHALATAIRESLCDEPQWLRHARQATAVGELRSPVVYARELLTVYEYAIASRSGLRASRP